jgi:myo-inositol-1-phosphate synthase
VQRRANPPPPSQGINMTALSPEVQPRSQRLPNSSRRKVRVAIIGVGNCASSLVQGVEFYKNASAEQIVPGLMHVNLGGYHIRDIEFSAAFDVDRNKVGKDLSRSPTTRFNSRGRRGSG